MVIANTLRLGNYTHALCVVSPLVAVCARVCPEANSNLYHYTAIFDFARSRVSLEADTLRNLERGMWSIRLQYHASARSFRAPLNFFLMETPELVNDCRQWHFATKKAYGDYRRGELQRSINRTADAQKREAVASVRTPVWATARRPNRHYGL